ncbi:MAG TPA: flagellar hook capping FlgD N-terminal domain-containing protein [Bacillota bacterium]|nr:flagellar hook capping FlgD N-terminal domain-containing protein [Bacillota bacterium]HOK68679.1 flagellar hook capping FlgD N-terminal domain-containing protein [Bacillota bacterium]HPP86181.1 flagellar hook capping FlgD N-terminal domain-containing protein [Bacillota bacterium]
MAVENIGSVQPFSAGVESVNNAVTRKNGTEFDINDFFKLMIAQLQNQSIDNTVDNTEFITQMAQFSTLTQISELTKSMQSSMSIALIGKTVSISTIGADGLAQTITGTVEKVSFFNGQPYLYVGDKYYEFSQVTDVTK